MGENWAERIEVEMNGEVENREEKGEEQRVSESREREREESRGGEESTEGGAE